MNKSVFSQSVESVRPELISEIIQNPDRKQLEIDNIPEDLKVRDQFLLHNKQKKPVDKTGGLLKDWPHKGMPFEEARELLRAELEKPESDRNFHGIGFMPKADGILCVDLDKARDSNGQIKPEIDQLVREIQSCGGWIEKSMSGNVHIWTRGQWPENKSKHGNIEVFYGTGYVCLTGRPLEKYSTGSIPKEINPLASLRQKMARGEQIEVPAERKSSFELFDQNQILDPKEWPLDKVIRDILPYLPEPDDYDLWVKVACGLKHQFGDEALDAFHDYSQICSEKYSYSETERLWENIKNSSNKPEVTLRTLIWMAHRNQMQNSIQNKKYSDAELDTWFPKVEISTTRPKPLNYVVDDFIAEGIFVIAGAPGSGKSSLIFKLATTVAHLGEVNDQLKPIFRRHVVYITEDTNQACDMLYGMSVWGGLNQSEEEIREWLTICEGRRTDPHKLADFVRYIARTKATIQSGESGVQVVVQPLIVVDTAAATFDIENESDNSQVSSAISEVKRACSESNTPLWIVAHTAKAMAEADKNLSARGAGAWTGDVHGTAYVLSSKNTPNERFLELGKIRYEPSFRSVRFVTETHSAWSQHTLGHTVERSYRVGQAFKQTENDVQQKILESKQQVYAAMEEEIISHLKILLHQGFKVTKTKLKGSVKGKAQTITDAINNLIGRNLIKVLPNNSLALGAE